MQSRHFTLKQFRYFLAVSETGSVAAAARMINIAQSAMTKSVQELEDTLGMRLFARSPKGMVLTQAGPPLPGQRAQGDLRGGRGRHASTAAGRRR